MKKYFKFITRKNKIYNIIAIAIIIIAGYFLLIKGNNKEETLTVHSADFLQQISASARIVSIENIDLSFEDTGKISGVYVKVGDNVAKGQLLSNQNTSQLNAELLEMEAGIELQKAKLEQLLQGTLPEDIMTKQNAMASAKQNLDNAYLSSLVTLGSSYTAIYNAYTTASYTKNTYFSSSLDDQSLKVQNGRDNINSSLTDAKNRLDKARASLQGIDIETAIESIMVYLNNTLSYLKIIRDQCDDDLYYSKVSTTDKNSLDTQSKNINTALADVVSSLSNISSYKKAFLAAQDELASTKAPARHSDIAVFQAQIKQAEASKQNVLAQLNRKNIYSPIEGIVTAVNTKVGSVFSANEVAVSLISSNNFQVESYIPEINISFIKVGNPGTVTLDAYGSETLFNARVISIDPAETIKDGVSTYKVVLDLENEDERIKSGMTGNVLIITEKKSNVIAVPQGIIINKDGRKFVKVKEAKDTTQKEVQTGSVASSGNIEIISGLKDGDVVILEKGK